MSYFQDMSVGLRKTAHGKYVSDKIFVGKIMVLSIVSTGLTRNHWVTLCNFTIWNVLTILKSACLVQCTSLVIWLLLWPCFDLLISMEGRKYSSWTKWCNNSRGLDFFLIGRIMLLVDWYLLWDYARRPCNYALFTSQNFWLKKNLSNMVLLSMGAN